MSTTTINPLIMGDIHKNFEDPMRLSRDIRKTKYQLLSPKPNNNCYVFIWTPFKRTKIYTKGSNLTYLSIWVERQITLPLMNFQDKIRMRRYAHFIHWKCTLHLSNRTILGHLSCNAFNLGFSRKVVSNIFLYNAR